LEIRPASVLNWQHTYTLSRFALLRREGKGFVLESPLTNRQFAVPGVSVLRILDGLSRPRPLESLLAAVDESQRPALRSFIEACDEAGLLTRVDDDGLTEEETSSLGSWEFHDLLFHAGSRLGRNRQPVGATYPLKGRIPEPPRSSLPSANPPLTLPRPNLDNVQEPVLDHVLERRRSAYGLKPLDMTTLGAFLYRTCRITSTAVEDDESAVHKVYPSAGGLHPLRVYVAVTSCEGCRSGLYLYLDDEHALLPIRDLDGSVQRLLSDARDRAPGLSGPSPALLVISARFQRTAWKYESIAYRLTLLEVGGLFQTMYLVATAMGLTACALACGDSDHFARTIGSDYYAETSVGEFLLGR
jgi:SagB-type dehydrogenase family enzyme